MIGSPLAPASPRAFLKVIAGPDRGKAIELRRDPTTLGRAPDCSLKIVESELFGHVRGAFTGAERDKQGLFEMADGGSLFLDEIADMSEEAQKKLLRVLEEGIIRRVGGSEPIRETTQQQFMGRACSGSGVVTNNNRSLEVGPEPDNGEGPTDNRWGGYIALPTLGGNYAEGQTPKVSGGPPMPTPAGTAELGAKIVTHLSWDFDARYHVDGYRYGRQGRTRARLRSRLARVAAGVALLIDGEPGNNGIRAPSRAWAAGSGTSTPALLSGAVILGYKRVQKMRTSGRGPLRPGEKG
jgi:hypothetical protein